MSEQYRLIRGVTAEVWFEDCEGGSRKLSHIDSLALRNHSPDGFEWGYSGSGPAQTALAILFDWTKNARFAQNYYQEFKWSVIAQMHHDGGVIDTASLEAWIAATGSNEGREPRRRPHEARGSAASNACMGGAA